jgi:hypothetical protein
MSEVVAVGDRVHVVVRRGFEEDVRRHFAGVVRAASDRVISVDGFGFVHDAASNTFQRSESKHRRVFSLTDAGHIITILPTSVDLERLTYATDDDRMVITDGSGFRIGVNEFGPLR